MHLRSAQATWCQDSEQSRPKKVLLEGFTYGFIRFGDAQSAAGDDGPPARNEVARRLAWVRRNPGYVPQP
ncbi:hypothetical protein [Streptomyces sp. NPDC048272]|uniref:hypothetical protein n=1 Tax=Streptomyces sp. NPDC048272 TaxID=3154616 RepID=UPI00342C5349